MKCTSSLPEVPGQGVDSLSTEAASGTASGGAKCNDPEEASSSQARAQRWHKSAVNEAGESQVEESKEDVVFLHQPRQDRGITTSAEHFLWTRHHSRGFIHSHLVNPRHNSWGEHDC